MNNFDQSYVSSLHMGLTFQKRHFCHGPASELDIEFS